MFTNQNILVVDDDSVSRSRLAYLLEDEGFCVSEASCGEEFKKIFASGSIGLILLEYRLAGEDSLELLKYIRQFSRVGVIMVSDKSDDVDRLLALEMGADDYLTKPYHFRELVIRSSNLLKRVAEAQSACIEERIKRFSGWIWNLDRRHLASPLGQNVHLSRGEFDLLLALVSNPGRVLTRDCLLDHLCHREWDPIDRTVDVLIGRLRKKIEDDPKNPSMIMTVHGVGYVFTGQVEKSFTPDMYSGHSMPLNALQYA